MITKINPKLTTIVKQPNRKNLQKASIAGLAVLAGSSMSGWHGPTFTPTDMVIPGGLDLKEKAYYLLKGKLPKSVYERWFPQDNTYMPKDGDQVVTINIGDGQYIGSIIEGPHKIGEIASGDEFVGAGHDITKDVMEALPGGTDVVGDDVDDDGLSAFEIWTHLAGMQ